MLRRMANLQRAWFGLLLLVLAFNSPAQSGAAPKVFKYAFPIAETGFDPAQISDLYSRTVAAAIFESLYTWDYLARPAKVIPNLADGMAQVSPDFKTFTFKIKKGVYFAADPAFKGVKRELTAQDFVYSFKRHYDPKFKSYAVGGLISSKVTGLNELRTAAIKDKTPFPYDVDVPGVRALDRYTLQFKLDEPDPRFDVNNFTDPSLHGIVAREVMEFPDYVNKSMEHPVGTGAFVLGQWKRSSRIVLERNPTYREVLYDGTPDPDDPESAALLKRLQGRRLPMVDRVEISIVEEEQPRWLAFLNAEHDMLERLPNAFAGIAIPNNKLAANLARQGIQMERTALSDMTLTYFNMEDPVVGGYTADKVALRRAFSLALDIDEEIRLARRNQAIAAQAPLQPLTYGYDKNFRSTMSEFSIARAKALLDMYGYVDKDGDGWRDLPDGKPMVIRCATTPDQTQRQLEEIFKKNLAKVGIKIDFIPAKWPENLKQARAGKLQMWRLGLSATVLDSDDSLKLGYGPAKGENNLARFDLPAFNALYEQQRVLPDGPERLEVMAQARKLLIAYMPYKAHTHRISTDLMQAWVIGYKRHPFQREFFKFLDIDNSKRPAGG
jgi:ABC-type transport system substrate-binding protein